MADLDTWHIRSATNRHTDAANVLTMAPPARSALMRDIGARPWRYAAIGQMAPSVVPCVEDGGMEPRPVLLRVFLVFDGLTWHTMDGGLARVIETDTRQDGKPASGDRVAKDVWVLLDEGGTMHAVPPPPTPPIAIKRTTADLPSRVADNMFWLGRYVERLEGSARLVRATLARLSRSDIMPHEMVELAALSSSLAKARLIPAESVAVAGSVSALMSALLSSLRESATNPGSIADLVGSVAHLTDLVRDRLTGDMYAAYTGALRGISQHARRVHGQAEGIASVMTEIMRFSASFAGLAAENMVRGGGWLFLELGRRMERAVAVCTQVGYALEQPPSRVEAALKLVLELCDSLITYRTRYLTVLQPAPVLDLVLADDGNPRGLEFQLRAIADLLERIAGPDGEHALSAVVTEIADDVRFMVQRVADAPDQAVAAAALPEMLHRHAAAIADLSDRVTRHYFALLPAAQTLGTGEEMPARGAA